MLPLILMSFLCMSEEDPFLAAETQWRAERDAKMTAETSWLNVVGLHWLKEGENRFGSAPDCDIVFDTHATVAHAGSLFLEDGKVRYVMSRGQRAVIDEKTVPEGPLEQGKVLAHNHLRMFLIERGGRLALRVRNLRAESVKAFTGLKFFRPSPEAVAEATFVPYDTPVTLKIPTVVDTEIEMLVPGELHFTLEGRECTLLPTLETPEDSSWFLMFKDGTSTESTYGGGRFLYVDPPVDGKTTLNFNRAINPPCAYTDFATCPIPPERNELPLSVEAGERIYKRPDGAH